MNLKLVPDADEPEAGQIFLDATFDNQTQTCFFDTGANSTKLISNSHFAKYASIQQSQLAGLSNKRVSVDRIQIHNVVIGNHSLGEHKIMRLSPELEIHPTIGIDLFQNGHLSLDFKKNEISFKKSVGKHPFESNKAGHILVTISISSLNLRTIWDTGAGLTTLDQKIIDSHPSVFRFIKTLTAGDTVTPDSMQLRLYEVAELRLGSIALKNVKVLGADFSPIRDKLNDPNLNGALGYNVLTHFNWHFDMKQKLYEVKE